MLPRNLLYQNKVNSSPAKSYTTLLSPNQSGPYSYHGASSTINIDIPTGGNRVLNPADSFLKFTIKFQTGADNSGVNASYVRLGAGGAHCPFQRLRLFHQGLLEDIDDYALIATKMLVWNTDASAYVGKHSALIGTVDHMNVSGTGRVTVPTCGRDLLDTQARAASGYAKANTTYRVTFCVQLMSIVGSLTDKYIPLYAMGAAPLRIELTTVNDYKKVLCTDYDLAGGFELEDVEFNANFIELGDDALATLYKMQGGGPLQFVVPGWRSYAVTELLTNGASKVMTIPARFSSLKSLFIVMTDKHDTPAKSYFANASASYGLTEYYFRIGSEIYPSKRPRSMAEFIAETCKALGSVGDINAQSLLSPNNLYNAWSASPSAGTEANDETISGVSVKTKELSFMIGIDLECYANADKTAIYSGYNTLTSDVQFASLFGTVGSNVTVRFNAFALFDQVLKIENGVAYVEF